jgi:hypothetical protein
MRRGEASDAAVPSPSANAAAPFPTSVDALQLQVGVADLEGESERDGVRVMLGVAERLLDGVGVAERLLDGVGVRDAGGA